MLHDHFYYSKRHQELLLTIKKKKNHLEGEPLTFFLHHHCSHQCSDTQLPALLLCPPCLFPRCEQRSLEVHWGPAEWKELARRRVWRRDAARNYGNPLNRPGWKLRGQKETGMNKTNTWQGFVGKVLLSTYMMVQTLGSYLQKLQDINIRNFWGV